jgi:hypothetical protein
MAQFVERLLTAVDNAPEAPSGDRRDLPMTATKDAVITDAKQLDATDREEVVKALGGSFVGVNDQRQLGRLYLALIGLLTVIALLSGLAAFVLYGANRDSAAGFMAVVTTIVGGLVGLFAPSPAGNNSGGG